VSTKTRNVLFILLGVLGLLLTERYSGPQARFVRSYGGNIAASFAVYFLITRVPIRHKSKRLVTAGLALTAVGLFEATDGFKVMSNTYDPLDYVANAIGIGLALWTDVAVSRIMDSATTRDRS
jgi:hypothetical protein